MQKTAENNHCDLDLHCMSPPSVYYYCRPHHDNTTQHNNGRGIPPLLHLHCHLLHNSRRQGLHNSRRRGLHGHVDVMRAGVYPQSQQGLQGHVTTTQRNKATSNDEDCMATSQQRKVMRAGVYPPCYTAVTLSTIPNDKDCRATSQQRDVTRAYIPLVTSPHLHFQQLNN